MSDFFLIVLGIVVLWLFYQVNFMRGRLDAQAEALIDIRKQIFSLAETDLRFVDLHQSAVQRVDDIAECIRILTSLDGIKLDGAKEL